MLTTRLLPCNTHTHTPNGQEEGEEEGQERQGGRVFRPRQRHAALRATPSYRAAVAMQEHLRLDGGRHHRRCCAVPLHLQGESDAVRCPGDSACGWFQALRPWVVAQIDALAPALGGYRVYPAPHRRCCRRGSPAPVPPKHQTALPMIGPSRVTTMSTRVTSRAPNVPSQRHLYITSRKLTHLLALLSSNGHTRTHIHTPPPCLISTHPSTTLHHTPPLHHTSTHNVQKRFRPPPRC